MFKLHTEDRKSGYPVHVVWRKDTESLSRPFPLSSVRPENDECKGLRLNHSVTPCIERGLSPTARKQGENEVRENTQCTRPTYDRTRRGLSPQAVLERSSSKGAFEAGV